jgi:hypothetical protein
MTRKRVTQSGHKPLTRPAGPPPGDQGTGTSTRSTRTNGAVNNLKTD